ncbi:MAG: hypothetical protein ABIK19_05725 [candidate division WOR-3 bacterium]
MAQNKFKTIVKIAFILWLVLFPIFPIKSQPTWLPWKDILTRLKKDTFADHEIYTYSSGNINSSSHTITLEFDASPGGSNGQTHDFNLGSVDYTDIDMKWGTGPYICDQNVNLAATASATAWGVSVDTNNDTITFTPPTDIETDPSDQIPASSTICFFIGLNAHYGGDGDQQIKNPQTAQNNVIIAADGGAPLSGKIAVAIVDDDQVVVTATVEPTFTFTISQNTCDLGTLTTSTVNECNYTLDAGTNAANGATITIQAISDGVNAHLNKDGAPTTWIDDYQEDTGKINAGTEAYGIDVNVTIGGGCTWGAIDPFDDNPSPVPDSISPLVSSSVPVDTGCPTEVVHKAAISELTEAGSYTQVVQYIATGTF